MVTNGKLSNEDYSLSCIVCGSQERVALVPHRAADKVRGIFCFCEKCWPEYAGATLRTEWIKDVGEVAPKDAAEALITSTNSTKAKIVTSPHCIMNYCAMGEAECVADKQHCSYDRRG